jgi:drug/metabolite transporter (DMT)-like permease
MTHHVNPALRGGLLATLSALLFGLSTPLLQRAGAQTGPFWTAACLYAGAAGLALLTRSRSGQEARLRRSDLPWLLGMAASGAVLAPVLLAWGLQRTSASSASLMLALEAVFTAVFAWAWYRETVDRRVLLGMALLLGAGLLLVVDAGTGGLTSPLGLAAVALATAAWGADNALSRHVADRDPGDVVAAKGGLGAAACVALALLSADAAPSPTAALALGATGASGYGLSLRVYLLAQRDFGATRTASVFALAPFVGAAVAVVLGERVPSGVLVGAGGFMLAGLWLHLAERHQHTHHHPALAHEHAHTHDDGHHTHTHNPLPAGRHSHWHQHDAQTHNHPHAPDLHHRHDHASEPG